MTKLYKPMLVPLGLTYPQYLVLLVLWEADFGDSGTGDSAGMSVSDLGARLFLDSGTLTPLLKRMEAAAWLSRRRATDDERRVIVSLTPAGRALRGKAALVPGGVALASGFSSAALGELTGSLQRLRSNLAAHSQAA